MAKYENPKIVEGPMGLKMPEATARAIEAAAAKAPRGDEFNYRRMAAKAQSFSLDAGSRTDVSFITTDAVDRDRDVVIPSGVDTSQYNGVVTFAHIYDALPVGRCLWIKPQDNGLIAKTSYAPKPNNWSNDWFPDAILSLMQMNPPVCTGKSIGFIPLGYREPSTDEIKARPELGQRVSIIDKSILLEYAVCPVPANPEAEMIEVAKTLKGFALDDFLSEMGMAPAPMTEPNHLESFVKPETIAAAVERKIESRRCELAKMISAKALDAFVDRLHMAKGTP